MINTSALIRNIRKRIVFSRLIEQALLFTLPAAVWLVIVSLLDNYYQGYLPLREIFYIPLMLWAGYAVVGVYTGLAKGELSDERILIEAGAAQEGLKDELISAWQLSKKPSPGTSEELSLREQEKIEKAVLESGLEGNYEVISERSLKMLYPLAAMALACALLYYSPYGILKGTIANLAGWGRYNGWEDKFTVTPGTQKLPWGAAVQIEVTPVAALRGSPALYVRSEGSQWLREELVPLEKGGYGYIIERLAGVTGYRVRWMKYKTREFRLEPVIAPHLGDFSLKYSYPAYTGMQDAVVNGNPSVSAIRGTRATITARSDKKLMKAELLKSWKEGDDIKTEGQDITAVFTVTRDGAYKIRAVGVDGSVDPDPEEYQVRVIADQPPRVDVLSPADDLIVSENAEIPVVAHVEDDFGITAVELVYKNGSRGEERLSIAEVDKGTNRKDIEYIWKISMLNPSPGDRISYYVEARDNDTQGGPKTAAGKTLYVEINDYMKEHGKIEDSLKDVRDGILGVLADQNAARQETKSLELAFSTQALNGALANQAKAKDGAQSPLDKLRRALENMENDPYTDFATYSEYRGLNSHLEYLKDNQMKDALNSIKAGDYKGAGKAQDEAIASLEKMALLSEDIWQYQRMRDLMNAGEELKKASADLRDRLSSGPQAQEINDRLAKLKASLDKINNQLSKLPHELPEDFINSAAIKKVDMASYQDALGKISDAVSKGDWAKAKQMLDDFGKSLQSLTENLDAAGEGIGFSQDGEEKLERDIEDYNGELKGVTEAQRSWVEKARGVDDARRRAVFIRQEEALKSLYVKQKALIGKANGIRAGYTGRGQSVYTLDQSLSLMGKVLDEFANKRVFNSQKFLEDIIKNWKETGVSLKSFAGNMAEQDRAAVSAEVLGVENGESEILEELKKGASDDGAENVDRGRSDTLSKEETDLAKRTFSLHKKMQEFTRKSSSIGPGAFRNLFLSAGEMNTASDRIRDRNSLAAVESGQKALELLELGQEGLKNAQEGLSGMKEKSGNKVSGAVRYRSGAAYGFRSVAVKLPGKDDYKPPKEFRQEIIEALKEKYPQKYDKIIKEYYKRLTE